MSDYLARKLNPLQLNIIGFKDVPFKSDPKFKPIFAQIDFIDRSSYRTHELPQQAKCRFNHSHVIFVGLQDPIAFRELLATKLVRVYLHDDEQYSSDPDVIFPRGRA